MLHVMKRSRVGAMGQLPVMGDDDRRRHIYL